MAERIVIERLSKTYAGGNAALCEISLTVQAGAFLVLLGPSGSGKTTLLRCLAGIERISSGKITMGASVVADGRAHLPPERREASMVFQDYALWPHMTACDNVAFALRRRRIGGAERSRRAQEMLERVGLGGLARRYPNELSGGEQQRVALARALIADTGLILCDEPLSNLDADLRERMRVEISALVREAGATTIYITHDQAEAFALADQVGVLEAGRLVQVGAPEKIYTSPATPFVARFTGLSGELPVRVRGAAGAGTVEVEPTDLAGARPFHAQSRAAAGREGAGLVMIRPTGVRLCSLSAGEHHLAGTVADVAFRGRGYEHAVDIPGHGRLTGVFASTRAARGDPVGLVLDAGGCHLFADGDDARPAAGGPVLAGPQLPAAAGPAPAAGGPGARAPRPAAGSPAAGSHLG